MKTLIVVTLMSLVAVLGTGCAAQSQCLRDNAALQAQHEQDQVALRDANGQVAVVSAAQAGDTFSSLAKEGWTAAVGAFGWAQNEAPIAARQTETAYNDMSARMEKAKACYHQHGGDQAHTFDEYRQIATACLNAQ